MASNQPGQARNTDVKIEMYTEVYNVLEALGYRPRPAHTPRLIAISSRNQLVLTWARLLYCLSIQAVLVSILLASIS